MGGPRGGLAALTKRGGGAVAGGVTAARATNNERGAGSIGGAVVSPAGADALWQRKQSEQSGS